MLKINPKWGKTAQSLLQKSLNESNPRIRERLMTLHFVASGEPGIKVAQKIGKDRDTISYWVKQFNTKGFDGIKLNCKGNQGSAPAKLLYLFIEHLLPIIFYQFATTGRAFFK